MTISKFDHFPIELRDLIAPYLPNPLIFHRVSKSVSQDIVLESFYDEIWEAYAKKPELTKEVEEVTALALSTHFACVKTVYEKIIARAGTTPLPPADASYIYAPDRLAAIATARAMNLCNFFAAFADSVDETFYEAQQFLRTLSGNPLAKEAAIIAWMNQHSARLAQFKELNLSKHKLTALPPQIGLFTGLVSLDLSQNGLKALPAEIAQCTTLTKINLAHNQCALFPSVISQLVHLTDLNLSHNQISTIPETISANAKLNQLILSYNQFRSIPAVIWQCTHLTNIDFSHNQITSLPDEIRNLNALEYLFLSHNLLTTIPAAIGELTKLEMLDLSHNRCTLTSAEILSRFPSKKRASLILITKGNPSL